MARENKEQQLDEETLRRRAAIRKAQRRRKATVAKFLNGVKAAFVLIVFFIYSAESDMRRKQKTLRLGRLCH